jgi:RNA polymerase sigma-70 factor (ECF subfamily)
MSGGGAGPVQEIFRGKAGDEASSESFAELISLCGEKAYNFAYRLAGNEHEARDLVSEAFLRALEHFGSYDPKRPFEAWLLRILHNIHLDGVRRYAHGRTVSLDAPSPIEEVPWEEILPGGDPEPGSGLVRQEEESLVQKALGSIPIHYRTAVILCDIEGFSYEDIGRIMACPLGTVRSRIHQGRTLIRKAWEKTQQKGGRLQ